MEVQCRVGLVHAGQMSCKGRHTVRRATTMVKVLLVPFRFLFPSRFKRDLNVERSPNSQCSLTAGPDPIADSTQSRSYKDIPGKRDESTKNMVIDWMLSKTAV
jgi:hypothetical protein